MASKAIENNINFKVVTKNMLEPALLDSTLSSYLELSNSFYQDLLGYKPEQTSLQEIPESQWNEFALTRGLNPNSSGIYLPRNQTVVIRKDDPLSLFHEYFGHGLYCEHSLQGRKLVELERKLLEEEKYEFQDRQFKLNDVQRFRQQSQTFQELDEFRKQNLAQYEFFAIWTEYLLSEENNLKDEFEQRYDSLQNGDKEAVNSTINFSRAYGDLAAFYAFGLARRTTAKRVVRLLADIYKSKLENIKFAVLHGSEKEFSDIDVFAVSDELPEIYTGWLDVNVVPIKDFEEGVKLFDVEISHPLSIGRFIFGNKNYFEKFRIMLNGQPITEEAIEYNIRSSLEQKDWALQYPEGSRERKIGNSYAQTYLANALALREGKKLFTRENLLEFLHSKKLIELKGGIE